MLTAEAIAMMINMIYPHFYYHCNDYLDVTLNTSIGMLDLDNISLTIS